MVDKFSEVTTNPNTDGVHKALALLQAEELRVIVALDASAATTRTAILDPELTAGLPARLTAAMGIDAFAHALEPTSVSVLTRTPIHRP